MENVSILDLSIFFIIVSSALIGIFRGFVKEALSIAAWIIATWSAISFGDDAAMYLSGIVSSKTIILGLAYGGVFFATLIVMTILSAIIAKLITLSGLGFANRVVGLLFGVCRGYLLIAILGLIVGMLGLKTQPWWKESNYITYFAPATAWLEQYVATSTDYKQNIQVPSASLPDVMKY